MKRTLPAKFIFLILCAVLLCANYLAFADDGYRLWLKYPKVDDAQLLAEYRQEILSINVSGDSKTCEIVAQELKNGLRQLLGKKIYIDNSVRTGSLIVGTPASSARIRKLTTVLQCDKLGQEGYCIKSV